MVLTVVLLITMFLIIMKRLGVVKSFNENIFEG